MRVLSMAKRVRSEAITVPTRRYGLEAGAVVMASPVGIDTVLAVWEAVGREAVEEEADVDLAGMMKTGAGEGTRRREG